MDEILEDKGMIGGPGLVIPRKLKAGISMYKAYGFLVRTRVRFPPAPPYKQKAADFQLLFCFYCITDCQRTGHGFYMLTHFVT